jgi:uncharacterized membrane protein
MNNSIPSPSPTSDRLAHLLNILVILALFIYAAATYAGLPERIPVHFTESGFPDRWADKSWGNWLLLPLVALGLTCLFYATTYLVDLAKKHPRWLSLPGKKEFLALPEEKQAPVWRRMKSMLYWTAVPMNMMILYAFHTTHTLATREAQSLVMWPIWLCMASVLLVAFGMTFVLIRSARTAVAEHNKSSPVSAPPPRDKAD